MPSAPQGEERLKKYVELLKHHIPTVAIGGIGLAQMAAVCATHVDGVALVSAITKADQPETVVHQLQQFFEVQDA
jgi:hydroxymethylpyrimidine kinase/phosphomethylpyrimidine kinase/thiamine-phosphate diphosphorylase